MINKPKEIKELNSTVKNWIAEPKLDGMRGLIRSMEDQFEILSENNNNKNLQFPELIPNLPHDTVIDGEICIPINDYNADFEALQKRMNVRNKPLINMYAKNIPVKFYAFDILRYKGKDTTDMTWKERREILKPLILKQNQSFELVQVGSPVQMLDLVKNMQGEGIVLKNTQGKYNDLWLKKKNWKEFDFRVSGVEVRSQNWVLNLANQDNEDCGKVVLTGYDKKQMKPYDLVGKTAVVKCLSFNKKVRIPILKEIRS